MNNGLILAIEAAIAGGSIAVVRDGEVLYKWNGESAKPRSEELLLRISEAFDACGINKNELSHIAVSNGPGSYTGIRIGIATAMGLSDSLGIPAIGVSLLKAIARNNIFEDSLVVVPAGRSGFCWQSFAEGQDLRSAKEAEGGNMALLDLAIRKSNSRIILCHTDAFDQIQNDAVIRPQHESIVDIGRDLAVSVADSSRSHDDGLDPYYVRDEPIRPKPAA